MNEHTPSKNAVTVSVAEAKAHFSELLKRAAAGENIHVTRHGKSYVKLVSDAPEQPKLPRVGAFKGQFKLPDNWDDIPTGFETYE